MKKFAALLLALMMIACCAFAMADEAKPLAGKSLRIGLSPNFMYFETQNEKGEYEGLDIDIIKALSEKLGFDYEIVPMDFSALIGSVVTRDLDMVISGLSYTEERAAVVDFSITYCTTEVGCVTPVDSDIQATADLQGKVVACSQGTTYEYLLGDMEGVTVKTFNGQAAVGTAVAEGVDGVAAGVTSINGSKKLSNTVLDAEGKPMLRYFLLEGEGTADQYNIAFQKGSDLTAIFDVAIQEMIDSGEMGTMIHGWLY